MSLSVRLLCVLLQFFCCWLQSIERKSHRKQCDRMKPDIVVATASSTTTATVMMIMMKMKTMKFIQPLCQFQRYVYAKRLFFPSSVFLSTHSHTWRLCQLPIHREHVCAFFHSAHRFILFHVFVALEWTTVNSYFVSHDFVFTLDLICLLSNSQFDALNPQSAYGEREIERYSVSNNGANCANEHFISKILSDCARSFRLFNTSMRLFVIWLPKGISRTQATERTNEGNHEFRMHWGCALSWM